MARFWQIYVVVLGIFLAATVDCARTSGSKATPKKTTQRPVVTTKKTEACGDQWTKNGASLFSFCTCTQPCTFNSAMKKCWEKQAKLAKVPSAEVEILFLKSRLTSKYFLLGGNDRVEEGTWRWPDGSLLNESYTNWHPSEPSGKKGKDCLVWYSSKWFDELCDDPYPAYVTSFVCEKKPL